MLYGLSISATFPTATHITSSGVVLYNPNVESDTPPTRLFDIESWKNGRAVFSASFFKQFFFSNRKSILNSTISLGHEFESLLGPGSLKMLIKGLDGHSCFQSLVSSLLYEQKISISQYSYHYHPIRNHFHKIKKVNTFLENSICERSQTFCYDDML